MLEIFKYISEELSAENAAQRFTVKIEKSIYALEDFPKMYPLAENKRLASYGCRKMTVDNFIVFYTVDDNEFEAVILGVFYGRRNYLDAVADRIL